MNHNLFNLYFYRDTMKLLLSKLLLSLFLIAGTIQASEISPDGIKPYVKNRDEQFIQEFLQSDKANFPDAHMMSDLNGDTVTLQIPQLTMSVDEFRAQALENMPAEHKASILALPDEHIQRIISKPMPPMTLQRHRIYVYCVNEQPVGFVRYFALPGIAMIGQLGVHKDFRRKGYAKALLEYALSDLKQTEYSAVMLDSISENHEAHKLYESLGFTKTQGVKNIIHFTKNL